MRRRQFITLLGGTPSLKIETRAQQTVAPRRIGVLLVGLSPDSKEAQHFRKGLLDAGYTEGRNLAIEWRSAKGDYKRVPDLALQLPFCFEVRAPSDRLVSSAPE